MIDYLAEHPTTATILAAVHEVKPRLRRLKKRKISENDFESALNETLNMVPDLGMPEKADDQLWANVNWAQEQLKKMKIN